MRVHAYPDGMARVFLGPHWLVTFGVDGRLLSPDAPDPGRVLGAVKDKPLARRAKCAALTAPARAADRTVRVGTEKRASSRTKKRSQRPDAEAAIMTPAYAP